jgi:hypothetical protein
MEEACSGFVVRLSRSCLLSDSASSYGHFPDIARLSVSLL